VALCDVDENFLKAAAELHPNARLYRDWRVLLAEEADNIDSVNIATTNHMHAPIAMTALRMGKHVYCEKPLTHSIFEARMLAEESEKYPEVVTQMGVQTHSAAEYRNAVAVIQAGAVGPIREVHSWDRIRFHYTGAFSDPHTERQPESGIDPPAHLDWDLWLGVAPERPYNDELYHIRMWRRWHDFGGGARGDMGGHMMDVVFDALELTAPTRLISHRTPPYADTYSPNNLCEHLFPGTPYTAGEVNFVWHDTGPMDTTGWPVQEDDLPGNGSMFIGEKGFVFVPHVGEPEVFPSDDFRDASDRVLAGLERREGESHFHQFVNACLGRATATTPFRYAGNLTESVLIGNIANRFPGEQLEWDAENLSFPNKPEANQFLRRDYRDGWRIEGLG
jgi:predicted dehydrogenase